MRRLAQRGRGGGSRYGLVLSAPTCLRHPCRGARRVSDKRPPPSSTRARRCASTSRRATSSAPPTRARCSAEIVRGRLIPSSAITKPSHSCVDRSTVLRCPASASTRSSTGRPDEVACWRRAANFRPVPGGAADVRVAADDECRGVALAVADVVVRGVGKEHVARAPGPPDLRTRPRTPRRRDHGGAASGRAAERARRRRGRARAAASAAAPASSPPLLSPTRPSRSLAVTPSAMSASATA